MTLLYSAELQLYALKIRDSQHILAADIPSLFTKTYKPWNVIYKAHTYTPLATNIKSFEHLAQTHPELLI
jgi:hypothetical protein